MINRRAKGARIERKAEKILQEYNWITYRVRGSSKFNLCVDIFGLIDIIAKKDGQTKWIQCKSNKKPKLKPLEDFAKNYCCSHESVEVWIHKDRQGFNILKI